MENHVSVRTDSPAYKRLERLFDEGTFTEIDRLVLDNGGQAPVICGYGIVNGSPVFAFSQDRDICCGAVDTAHAAKIRKIYQLAGQNGVPVVGIFDSDGVRLDDGLSAMDAIAEILAASNELSGVVPQIAVVAGACVGSAALIAASADVVVAVRDADYYLTSKEDLTVADLMTDTDMAAVEKARVLLDYLPANNLEAAPVFETGEQLIPAEATTANAAEVLADAGSICPFGAEKSSVTSFARIGGLPCGIVTLAGETISCADASRAARFVRICDAFSVPVLTVVDAAGFACLKGASKVSQAYAEATTVKVTLITGKAYGSVYIAVAGKKAGSDVVLAWPQASVSALAPATAINIVWKDRLASMNNPVTDRPALEEEYRTTVCAVQQAAAQGAVMDIVEPKNTRALLTVYLEMLAGKRVTKLPKKHANLSL